ncbi:hypothetical protein [Plantactinospora soyae]|uniref:Uncharacterized protein n=1 Tax=Plantactinospora soyae TaxID=1544732 RepID=A0A927M498_9ACTN|nr:hypothetical protein [Plantactinospora soyae]MBE1486657.1 hypothetical protein [Plantactinospora soyae]
MGRPALAAALAAAVPDAGRSPDRSAPSAGFGVASSGDPGPGAVRFGAVGSGGFDAVPFEAVGFGEFDAVPFGAVGLAGFARDGPVGRPSAALVAVCGMGAGTFAMVARRTPPRSAG